MTEAAPPRPAPWSGADVAVGLLLGGLAAWFQVWWNRLDTSLVQEDDASLLRMSVCVARGLHAHGLTVPESCVAGTPYPPLVPLWTALWYGLRGAPSLDLAQESLWLFHFVAAAALYAGARAEAGRLGAAAVAATGIGLWSSGGPCEGYFTEIAVAAAGAAAWAGWAWSDGGRRPGPLLGVGVALGAGLLAKWSFAFFLGVPALLWAVLVAGRSGAPRVVAGALAVTTALAAAATLAWLAGLVGSAPVLATAGLVAVALAATAWGDRRGAAAWLALVLPVLLLAGPWYAAHADLHRRFLLQNVEGTYAGDPLGFAEAWPFYPLSLYLSLGTVFAAALVVAAVRAAFPGRSPGVAWSLVAGLSGLLALMAAPYRTARYVSPALVLLAPAVAGLRAGRGRRVAWVVLLAWGLWFPFSPLWPGVPGELGDVWVQPRQPSGGNNHAALREVRATLRDLPLVLPLVRHRPNRYALAVGEVMDVVLAHARPGPLVIGVAGLPNNLGLALEAELGLREPPGRPLRVDVLPLTGDLAGAVRAGEGNRFVWVATRPDTPVDGRMADAVRLWTDASGTQSLWASAPTAPAP